MRTADNNGPRPEERGIVFKPEFAFGHLVQIIAMLVVAVGVWYGLVADVKRNQADIALNSKSIEELRISNNRLLETVNENAERREIRMTSQMNDIKQDVSWLVRREADKASQ